MSRKNISEKETKALIANSGGVCAFPGCTQRFVEPGNAVDDEDELELCEYGRADAAHPAFLQAGR